MLWSCGGGGAGSPVPTRATSQPLLQRIGSDPFGNAVAQHATVVEPSALSVGTTIVAAYQAGRYPTYGASDIDFATSTNAGASWISGTLPGVTRIVSPEAQFDGASDPAVAFDAAHRMWLVSSVPVTLSSFGSAALVSRSSDGFAWSDPVDVVAGQNSSDKPWSVCDNTVSSPHYGHCYVGWDESGAGGVLHISTSSDGGATWSAPLNVPGNATGIGVQPLVRPDGTLVVTYDDANEQNILAFTSRDGGVTLSAPSLVSNILTHRELQLRSPPFPSTVMDAVGRMYLVWQDCRYRTNCGANDLLLVTSADGVAWSAPARVPIDSLASTADHFIPGLSVDATTSGATAHLGLSYYTYSDTACAGGCRLFAAFVGSQDGGASWSSPAAVAGPMQTAWLPNTDDGPMVGDYIATVFASRNPIGFFAVANAPAGAKFDEALYASTPGALSLGNGAQNVMRAERSISTRSDRPLHPGP